MKSLKTLEIFFLKFILFISFKSKCCQTMEGGLREEFGEEHRVALFDVVENLLKTDNFKVRIEPGSKKGIRIF